MDIGTKLKYIKEGYWFKDILSETFECDNVIKETDQIFVDYLNSDLNYLTEVSKNIISGATIMTHIKKILLWLKNKISQFINFMKHKLTSSRKGNKQTIQNIKHTVQKLKSQNHQPKLVKHIDHHAEGHEQEEVYKHNHGDTDSNNHDIILFDKILTHENFFDAGFKKVYNILSDYIEKLERNPENHINIINDSDLINTNPFLNKIFNQALSINYDKRVIFLEIYGDKINIPVTVRDLMTLADKLQKLDNECQIFSDWIQHTLPDTLEKIESRFEMYIKNAKNRINLGTSKNIADENILIEELTQSLNKIIKLINIQMSIIRIFAHMHAEVFMHIKSEVEHYDWVVNPTDYNYDDYDNNGLIH